VGVGEKSGAAHAHAVDPVGPRQRDHRGLFPEGRDAGRLPDVRGAGGDVRGTARRRGSDLRSTSWPRCLLHVHGPSWPTNSASMSAFSLDRKGWSRRRLALPSNPVKVRLHEGAMDDEALATLVVQEYVEHYADYDRAAGRSADLAALRLKKMDDVKREFAALVEAAAALQGRPREGLAGTLVRTDVQRLTSSSISRTFADQLRKLFPGRGGSAGPAKAVIGALRSCVIHARLQAASPRSSRTGSRSTSLGPWYRRITGSAPSPGTPGGHTT